MDDAKAARLKQEVKRGWTDESPGWIKHADQMDAWLHETTALVLAGARLRPRETVLDLASGPGRVAFAAAPLVAPGGRVVSSDLVGTMVDGALRLARAREIASVRFAQVDAEAIPFADASFDAVTCLHGVMFFPRVERAIAEIRRVLRPGGRVSLVVWGPPDRNPFLTVQSAPFLRRLPPATREGEEDEIGPFRFSAEGALATRLKAAGFSDVEERVHEVPIDLPGPPDDFWAATQEISSTLFAWFRADLTPQAYDDAAREVQAAVRSRFDGERVRFSAAMVLATARRPNSA